MTPVDAGPPIATVNPANGELLETFEPSTPPPSRPGWPRPPPVRRRGPRTTFAERSRLLITVAELLEGELPDIAHTVTTEMGKPFAQAKGEVAKCASGFRWFAEHAEEMLADQEVPVDASLGLVTYQPLGAVLAIMPWNFPLWQVARFLAPAVMAGNVGPAQARAERAPDRPAAGGPVPPGRCARRGPPDAARSAPTRCRRSSPTPGWRR